MQHIGQLVFVLVVAYPILAKCRVKQFIPILCEVAYNRKMAFMVRFMARLLKITIEESAEFLEKQLKNTRTASQKERIQVLWWLKTGQVQEHAQISASFG